MAHFKFGIVDAGKWTRMEGTVPGGGDDEARPHLIATTQAAQRFVEADALGALGAGTGLCPGYVEEDGKRIQAYRFIQAPPNIDQILTSLNEEVERFLRK